MIISPFYETGPSWLQPYVKNEKSPGCGFRLMEKIMNATEFQFIWQELLKTQKQMSEILGISLKAIQSFEQGWRKIPPYVERQALFLIALKMRTRRPIPSCWEIRRCPSRMRENCPAWELKSGHLCWFIDGTIRQGKPQKSWAPKMLLCKKCQVFGLFTKHWSFLPGSSSIRGREKKTKNIS